MHKIEYLPFLNQIIFTDDSIPSQIFFDVSPKNNINRKKKIMTKKNSFFVKKCIFPPIANDKIPQLMIDDDSFEYITYFDFAQQITNIIMNNLSNFPNPNVGHDDKQWYSKSLEKKMKNLVITEMTAGVGGNVLNFAFYFKYVNAIEIDKIRFDCLNKNIETYEFDNINSYHDDSIKLLVNNDDIVQDIIFFDPPWGGKSYKKFYNLRLYFGNYTIENICKKLFCRPRNKLIVLKLPNNYDFDYLFEELKDYKIFKVVLIKMTIVVLKNFDIDQ